MSDYHAIWLNGPFGWGFYIARRENGVEVLLDRYFCADFPESRFEAEQLAKHLNERNQSNSKMFIQDNRARRRVNE